MTLYQNFSFNITHQDTKTKARLGLLNTPHGTVETPNFIFCGTKATVKGVTPSQMIDEGTQFILSNTYHLMLQPGADLVEKMGGLHKFMGFNGPMLTDSGGFQVFSLGHGSVANEVKGKRMTNRPSNVLKINEEGVTFKSYIDGHKITLTPEKSIDIQRKLGADIILVFDECTPFHVSKEYTAQSTAMTHRWALRSLTEFKRTDTGKQALYGIIQGGIYEDLRKESASFINAQNFFGHAIGGSLGATKEQMHDIVAMTRGLLSDSRPVHLLGIGGVDDIWNGIRYGIDTFDCVHPTRMARHGHALSRLEPKGHINILNARFKDDDSPLEEDCPCHTCQNYSRAYIHHLFKAKELLGLHLLTLHNVRYMNRLMAYIRQSIAQNQVDEGQKAWGTAKTL